MLRFPMGHFDENGSGRLNTLLVDRIESMKKTLAHLLSEMTAKLVHEGGNSFSGEGK